MSMNFYRVSQLMDKGTIRAGHYQEPEIKSNFYNYSDVPSEIPQDNLLFTINYGSGGSDSQLEAFQLIWEGKYYST